MPEVDRAAPTPIPGRGAGRTPMPTATPVPESVKAPKATPSPPASLEAEDLAELVEPDEMLEPSAEVEPAAAAPPAAPESSFASILDDALAEAAAPEPEPAPRPTAEGTESLEPLYGVPPDEPTPAPLAAAAPGGGSIPAASRRAALVAVAAASVLGLALLAYAVARRPASPPPDPAAVAADADAQLGARLASADRRISEGRLGGEDGALEQLLAAKALRANDARVNDRLRLLADTLEMLGDRALGRGNAAEAEVHLSAARQAAPDRPSISAKLEAAAKMSGAPGARPGTGAGGTPP